MSSSKVMSVFDVIIIVFGLYGIFCAVRMKKSGVVSAFLFSEEELPKLKDGPGFCREMYRPTVLLGIVSCLFGIADIINRYVLGMPYIQMAGVACFLAACGWFVNKMRAIKEKHI